MYRNTTTATLLAGLAVGALSGCVAVEGRPDSVPQPRMQPPGAARAADPGAEPQIVQAPALEALEMMPPAETPEPVRTARAPAPAREQAEPGHRVRPVPRPTPAGTVPAARPAPPPPPPAPGKAEIRGTADVCALGRKYGGWRPGSPESRICEDSYGD